MRRIQNICGSAGYIILAFGGGILLSNFLPLSVLVVIEGVIIIAAGIIYLINK